MEDHYMILRPCLWFVRGQKVEKEKFHKYFTEEALEQFFLYGYIEKYNNPNSMADKIKKYLEDPKNLEEVKKFFEEGRWDKDIPKGWVSIEDHLPKWCIGEKAEDMFAGTPYKVKNKEGLEFMSHVLDHNVWYYGALEQEITHWFNK